MLKSAIPVDNSPYVFGYMVNNGLSLGDKTKKKMIKASELRIGNLLEFSNGIEPAKIVMVGRRFFSSAAIEKEDGDFNVTPYYRGIPLTSDWLIRFGFKKNIAWYLHVAHDRRIELGVNNDNSTLQYYTYFRQSDGIESDYVLLRKDLMFVHQLQTLFFALTGKELSLDSKPEISTSSTLPDSTTAK